MIRLLGYMIGFALLIWAIMIIAAYALLVAAVGGVWALVEINARSKGRPYIEPGDRFRMVWSRAMSLVDPKHWVTADTRPATDPHLLPGQVTGDLCVENRGVTRIDETGLLERFIVSMRLHNHGAAAIRLDDLAEVDLQLWTPTGKVIGRDAEWSTSLLEPDHSCDVDATVRLVDDQPVASWAIAHHPQGGYLFSGANAPKPRKQGV